nr:triple gene block protein 2 [Banmivirus BanMMV]UTM72629.1 triple gene block protein 2 [Banmivirus BanMMV]UUL90892.1 triple gene block protein 2 [Banmivirus BanMMV]
MNKSLEKLKLLIENFGFTATDSPITSQIVIHGVAGSGKSTLTKELAKDTNFNVVNILSKEEFNLAGQFISKSLATFENKINVLDEYLAVNSHEGFQVLLADPFQYKKKPYPANYIKNKSHRFKKELIPILSEISIELEAEKEGLEVVKGSAYEIEPEGQIISVEEDVSEYVEKHGLQVHNSNCVQGQEFEVVTFYHNKDLRELNRSEVYIALTRVKTKLKILQL